MEIAFAPERDSLLLLGRISREEWAAAIAAGLAGQVGGEQASALGTAFAYAPSRADGQAVEVIRRVRQVVPVVLVPRQATFAWYLSALLAGCR
jgi:putative hydrolase of the HAD superfamily